MTTSRTGTPAGGLRAALVPGAIAALAAFAFLLTLGATVQPLEEGIILHASWRVAQGAVPYRDFLHLYTPAVFWLYGALFAALGAPDLFAARLLIWAWKVGLAVLVYGVAARLASRRAAVLVAAVFIAVWAAPVWLFESPYPSHFGVGLTLLAVWVLLEPRWPLAARLAICGVLLGLAALFKQTLGVFNTLAVLLAWIGASQRGLVPGAGGRAPRLLAAAPAVLLVAAGVVYLVYIWPHRGAATSWILAGPALGGAAVLAWREVRGGFARWTWTGLGQLATVAVAAALPPVACALWYAATGNLGALIESTLTLPRMMTWFDPLPRPTIGLLASSLALVGALAAPRAWRRRASAAALAWLAVLVLALGAAAAGVLPITWPDLFEIYRWSPIALTVGLLRAALSRGAAGDRDRDQALLVCWFMAAATLLQWYPAADLAHVGMTLPVFLPLLAVALDRFVRGAEPRPAGAQSRQWAPALVAAALTAVALAPFVRAIWAAAGWPRRDVLARASGRPTSATAALAKLVGTLRREPGPLLVLTGDELIYILTGRESAAPHEQHAFYLIVGGLLDDRGARHFVDEAKLIDRLDASGATVLERTQPPAHAARVRARLPVLAAHLDARYAPREQVGPYRVLRPLR